MFNWRIIALQVRVGFCHTSTWISCRYTYFPSLLSHHPTSHPIPLLQVVSDHWNWVPCDIEHFSTGYLTFSSVQFSHSGVTECSLHGVQHSRPPCPSPIPEFTQTMSTESMMPSNHLILFCPLLLLPSIFRSIRIFSNESVLCIWWPKYWSFSFSISSSNAYPGLISFQIHWFDLLAVQGTLKSLLQHHSSKASILWHSAFFIVQLSHPSMTTGKTIALTR